jgi:hypothetical protein
MSMGKRKTRRQRKRQKRQQSTSRARRAEARSQKTEPVDRRSLSVDVKAIGGVPVSEPQTMVLIEPIHLPSGDDLYFQSPFVVPFYLLKSKMLRDGAEPKRLAAIRETAKTPDGTLRPLDPSSAFDALEDLALAVILAAAAIETHANDMIGRLPDDTTIEVPTQVADKTIPVMRNKAAMDRLRLGEKLTQAAPLLTGRSSIKGTAAWEKYKRLIRLRNALLHVKRVAVNDPLKPSAFGRLMLGEGSNAPEDAAAVIEALEPGWIPDHVRPEVGL